MGLGTHYFKRRKNAANPESTVKKIYAALRHTEKYIADDYAFASRLLPEKITFITTQELEDRYPSLTPKERELTAAKKYGAIFLMQIGGMLRSGNPHDGRAPDYDDWSLNGDIIVYYELLGTALELSSMGIRVDEASLLYQLKEKNCLERTSLPLPQGTFEQRASLHNLAEASVSRESYVLSSQRLTSVKCKLLYGMKKHAENAKMRESCFFDRRFSA